MKQFLILVKSALLIFPFILTIIMKIIVFIGFTRMQLEMSDRLDGDMLYIVPQTSRWLNMFWDLKLGNYPDQPHHKPIDVFGAAISGSFTILKLLFLSLFSWRR